MHADCSLPTPAPPALQLWDSGAGTKPPFHLSYLPGREDKAQGPPCQEGDWHSLHFLPSPAWGGEATGESPCTARLPRAVQREGGAWARASPTHPAHTLNERPTGPVREWAEPRAEHSGKDPNMWPEPVSRALLLPGPGSTKGSGRGGQGQQSDHSAPEASRGHKERHKNPF